MRVLNLVRAVGMIRLIGLARMAFIGLLVGASEDTRIKYSHYLVSMFVNHNDFDRTARLWITRTDQPDSASDPSIKRVYDIPNISIVSITATVHCTVSIQDISMLILNSERR